MHRVEPGSIRNLMSDRLHFSRLRASVADIVDSGIDVLPHFEMAAIAVLEGMERPGEWPEVRRKLRAEGLRAAQHRGVLLLTPGDLERASSSGLLGGSDEVFLLETWDEEFESFPGRITGEDQDFSVTTPLGLEEWMVDVGCLLAAGDGHGVNFATLDGELAERLRARFPVAKG